MFRLQGGDVQDTVQGGEAQDTVQGREVDEYEFEAWEQCKTLLSGKTLRNSYQSIAHASYQSIACASHQSIAHELI